MHSYNSWVALRNYFQILNSQLRNSPEKLFSKLERSIGKEMICTSWYEIQRTLIITTAVFVTKDCCKIEFPIIKKLDMDLSKAWIMFFFNSFLINHTFCVLASWGNSNKYPNHVFPKNNMGLSMKNTWSADFLCRSDWRYNQRRFTVNLCCIFSLSHIYSVHV